jgi:hypothetical protein
MRYKKLIIIPAVFILSNILYISCCKCPEVSQPFYTISKINVIAVGSAKAIIDTGAITTVDSVFLNYNFINNCVAKAENPFAFLVNQSYACDCISCGLNGLKNKIDTLEISCDSTYNGIAPNKSLNQFFKVAPNASQTSANNIYGLDSLKTIINSNKDGYASDKTLFTTTKPRNSLRQAFKLRIVFVGGKKLEAITNRIRWN